MKSSKNNSAGGPFLKKKRSSRSEYSGARAQQFSCKYSKMLNNSSLTCACGRKFVTTRSLRYHVRSCNSMTCCGRRYANAQLLRRHNSIAHCENENVNVTIKTLSCKFCGKDNFTSARGRDAHTNRFCKRNPNSYLNLENSELKSSSSTKEEKHAKKTTM